MSKEFLKEGDIFELKKGHKIYACLPAHFLYDSGSEFDFSIDTGEVEIGIMQRGLDTSIFEGEYVVTKTLIDGGSGSSYEKDYYPSGYHVYAKKIYKNMFKMKVVSNFEISFYQSGCFTCMIENIKPARKAKVKYEI